MKLNYTVLDRFLRYVTIDTQSDPESNSSPSTEKQKNLGKLLVEELKGLGILDAEMDSFGIVYATIPSNSKKNVPTICLCAHMDTSPDCSGTNVKPVVHKNYEGNDLKLPSDPSVILKMNEHEDLKDQIGNDLITSDGTTLLGADNKSGIAAIMDAASQWMNHPEINHGTIRILFTPDEEIGRGVNNVDMKKLGASFGYTIDGETIGTLENETWSADIVTITIKGVSAHPGFAKNKMESAIKIAAAIIDALPKDRLSPETTEDRDGFVHPVSFNAMLEEATIKIIIRDFTVKGLQEKEKMLNDIVTESMKNFPNSSYQFKVDEQYRNMKEILDQHPQVCDYAMEAINRAGMKGRLRSIRGGTDGSRLSFMGMPCPNLFAGEHAFHSKQEWTSVQDMQKAVDTLIHLCSVWEERS